MSRNWTSTQTATVFVDLLGLSNALEDLDKIHKLDLSKEDATPLAKKAIGTIQKFRGLFVDSFRAYEEIQSDLNDELENSPDHDIPPHKSDKRLIAFSDCILINVLITKERALESAIDILHVCNSLIYSCASMLLVGQLVRGGMETGFALDGGEQEVLGSGLVHAYKLESQVAEYPRIAIGPRFMGFVSAISSPTEPPISFPAGSRQAVLLSRVAAQVRQLITTDPDGIKRLRIITPDLHEIWSKAGTNFISEVLDSLGITKNVPGVDNPSHFKKVNWARSALLHDAKEQGIPQ